MPPGPTAPPAATSARCGTPPPAARQAQQFSLDDTAGTPALVFRVNNGAVVLNDTTDGGVFLIDTDVTNVRRSGRRANPRATAAPRRSRPGPAEDAADRQPYTQGVRPGTTTVVHVLDAAKGPAGDLRGDRGRPARPAGGQRGGRAGRADRARHRDHAVDRRAFPVHDRRRARPHRHQRGDARAAVAERERRPAPAPRATSSRRLSVASGGTMVIPVIGDWRDYDGDPLYIDSGSVAASAGSAAVTSGGALSFTAPQTAANETVTISYGVSDGRVAKPTMATLTVSVLGSSSTQFVAPVAEPDAAQAVAGAPGHPPAAGQRPARR